MIAIRVLCLVFIMQATAVQFGFAGKCYNSNDEPTRCMPGFINAAYLKDISASNTCGMDKPTSSCNFRKICKICDAKKADSAHPAKFMNDASMRSWWQSETLLESKKPVRIILDLGKTFDVVFIRIKFHSPRPYSFAIYKKSSTSDDAKWTPFQYYSKTCRKFYKTPPNQFLSRANQKTALCSENYSGFFPFSGGNVAFSTIEGRPDRYRFDGSKSLQVKSEQRLYSFSFVGGWGGGRKECDENSNK